MPHRNQYDICEEIQPILRALAEQITENGKKDTDQSDARATARTEEAEALLTALSQQLIQHSINRLNRELWDTAGRLMLENERLQEENNRFRALYGPLGAGGPISGEVLVNRSSH